jgi:membrane protein
MRVLMLQGIGIIELGRRSIKNFFAHRMTTYAAALAYRGLFGLFPFVLLVVVLLGLLQADGFFQRMLEQYGPTPPQGVSGALPSMVEEARKRASGGLLSFGVVVSLYSVYTLARTLVEALNVAYEVEETRPAWKRLLLLVAFGPTLATATITAIGGMLIGSHLAERIAALVGLDDVAIVLWSWLRLPVALLLLAVVLSVVYRFAPDADQPYRLVTLGAAVAVIAWAVASLGFSLYLANFADYSATYGSLGAAIGLLFYLYLSASVVLLGAEINATIYHLVPESAIEEESRV